MLPRVVLLTTHPPSVITLPSSVTKGWYCWHHPHYQWYIYPPLLPSVILLQNTPTTSDNFTLSVTKGWYFDNTPTTSKNFTLLCYQMWYGWKHPHYKGELYPHLLPRVVLLLTIPYFQWERYLSMLPRVVLLTKPPLQVKTWPTSVTTSWYFWQYPHYQ